MGVPPHPTPAECVDTWKWNIATYLPTSYQSRIAIPPLPEYIIAQSHASQVRQRIRKSLTSELKHFSAKTRESETNRAECMERNCFIASLALVRVPAVTVDDGGW